MFTTKLDRRQLLNPCIKDSGIDNEFTAANSSATPGTVVDVLHATPTRGYRGVEGWSTNGIVFGALNAWAWTTDTGRFFPRSDTTWVPPATATSVGILTNDVEPTSSATYDNHSTVRYRVPAFSFEVTNTTAEIYKQGNLTSVRVPSGHTLENTVGAAAPSGTSGPWNDAGTALGHYGSFPLVMFDSFVFPPDTIDSAVLSGALQRAAKKGAYSVTATDLEHCQLERDALRFCAFGDGNIQQGSTVTGLSYANAYADLASEITTPGPSASIGAVRTGVPALQHFTERDCIAVYLTGLSSQTTYNVSITAQVEIAPVDYDVDYRSLVPLKRVPPTENEHILDIYRNVMSTMPSSVPVDENSLGEWFSKVVDGIKNATMFAAKNIAPMFGPEGAMLGNIAQKVLSLTSNVGRVQRTVQKVAGQVGGVKAIEQKQKKKKPKALKPKSTRNARG